MKWHLPYQGRVWVFDDSRITASEARLQKRITGGMTPATAATARFELDPDVFVAALAIARKRAGLELAEAVAIDDDELDLTAIVEATEAAVKAEHAKHAEPAAAEADEIVRSTSKSDTDTA